MDYRPMNLSSLPKGMSARTPVGHREVAVLEGLTAGYLPNHLKQPLQDMKRRRIKKIVVDLSAVPDAYVVSMAAVFMGALDALNIRSAYTGFDNVRHLQDAFFTSHVSPRVSKSTDAAVMSLEAM